MSADQDMTRIDLAEAIARHATAGQQSAPADPEPTHRWAPQDKPADLLDPDPIKAGRPFAPEPVPQPCRCDECKYGHRPGAGVVLYTGPDAVEALEAAAIRDGRYEDVHAFADKAVLHYRLGFEAADRHSRRTIESGYRRVEAVLRGAA